MKPKTGFESGSSPTISENGAPVLTGRGLQEVRERIRRAFEQVHGGQLAPLRRSEEKQPQVYTETQRERFHQRVKALSLRALTSSHISKSSRSGVFEVAVPTESAEQLIREALGE
jgi:hypothetical protein